MKIIPTIVVGAGALLGAMALASYRRKPGGNVEIIRPDWMGPAPGTTPKKKGVAKAAPPPPAKSHAAQVVQSIPSHAVSVTPGAKAKPAVKPLAKAAPAKPRALASSSPSSSSPSEEPDEPAATPATPAAPSSSVRKPTQAAQELYDAATAAIRSGHSDELGTKGSPSAMVKAAQHDMKGKLVADGLYGPKTMARGKELLGREFPARSASAPATSTAEQAASDLYEVLAPAARAGDVGPFGSKSHPSPAVKAAQQAMGGGLVADGIYGPKTQARGAKLLMLDFPTRPKG